MTKRRLKEAHAYLQPFVIGMELGECLFHRWSFLSTLSGLEALYTGSPKHLYLESKSMPNAYNPQMRNYQQKQLMYDDVVPVKTKEGERVRFAHEY